jgi:pyruvate,water dikinase
MARGNVVVATSKKELDRSKEQIDKETLLIFNEHYPEIENVLTKVAGIVSDTGGITSDVAILCREIGIPCVVGTQIGTKMLKQGENILVDGSVGAIYGKKRIEKKKETRKKDKKTETPTQEEEAKEDTVNRVKTATKIFLNIKRRLGNFSDDKEFIEPSDGIATIRMQDIYRKIGRHPEAYIEDEKEKLFIDLVSTEISPYCDLAAGDPVFIGVGSTTVAKYKNLTKGKTYEKWTDESGIGDKSNGLQRLLKKDKEIDILTKTFRHLRNKKGWRELSISVEYPSTPDMLIEFKKKLTSSGLQRSSTFKLYMTVNTPSEAMIIEDFKDVDLDGFIINTIKLSRYMQAPSATDPSVLKVVENIVEICEDERVIVQLPRDSENILEKLVKTGVYGVSIKADELEDISKKIAEIERSVVFKQ